jgi:four helix bundle protein
VTSRAQEAGILRYNPAMKFERFEDIQIWQKAQDLCVLLYLILASNKDFKFRDQLQSAAVSIMNNVAEGFERQNKKEFARFLYIARGSCGEVRSMAYLAVRLKYLSQDQFQDIHNRTTEISRMTHGLIKSITSVPKAKIPTVK